MKKVKIIHLEDWQGFAIMKFLSSTGFQWYHFFAIGNTFSIIGLLIAMHFVGGIKKTPNDFHH